MGLEPTTFRIEWSQARFHAVQPIPLCYTSLLLMSSDYTYMSNVDGRARPEKKLTMRGIEPRPRGCGGMHALLSTRLRRLA